MRLRRAVVWRWQDVLAARARLHRAMDGGRAEPHRPPREVLVLRTDALGDMVVFTPTLRALRRALPGSRITVLTGTAVAADYLNGSPYVDRCIRCDVLKRARVEGGLAFFRQGAFLRDLAAEGFDLVLASTLDQEAWYQAIAYATGAPERIGFSDRSRGLWTRPISYDGDLHEVRKNLDLVRAVGGEAAADDVVLESWATPGETGRIDAFIASSGAPAGRPLVGLSPFSKVPAKEWPADRWAAVIDAIHEEFGAAIVAIGSGDERQRGYLAGLRAASRAPIADALGLTTPAGLVHLIRRLGLLLAVDSGPQHIAALQGVPLVTLFGPTDPGKWYPGVAGAPVIVAGAAGRIEAPADGRPAGRPGGKVDEIDTARVIEAVRDLARSSGWPGRLAGGGRS